MYIGEKIFVQKLQIYTGDVLKQFNTFYYPEFLQHCKNKIAKDEDFDQILQIFYFNKNFDLYDKHQLLIEGKKLNENFCKEMEKEVLNTFMSKKKIKNITGISQTYQFLRRYGNFNKNILNNLYSEYEKLDVENEDNEKLFLKMSKVFLLNSYNDKNWEDICIEKIPYAISSYEVDSLTMKLLRHLNKSGKIENLEEFKVEDNKYNISNNKTLTQMKLKETLIKMNINFTEEYKRDDYTYDYFLPDLDIVLEYDGPDHFYPLQTQLNEQSKFRYRNIKDSFSSKIIIIPYFEYLRYDNLDSFESFLRKLIYRNYDFFNGPLFYENYDVFKQMRNYENIHIKL